jgi:hypothetical protein
MTDDALFGRPPKLPGLDDVERGHLVALAHRVEKLARDVGRLADAMGDAKKRHDEILARLPTLEEMKLLREILSDKAGRAWLQRRLKVYGIGGLGLLVSIYATRQWLAEVFSGIGRILRW